MLIETQKYKQISLISLLALLIILPTLQYSLNNLLSIQEDRTEIDGPRSSGFWVMEPLHIKDSGGGGDYTWAQAVLEDWCNGSGTLNYPYVIENITIDAGWSANGILIEDSNNKFFTIRNCTVMNSGTTIDANAGIELRSTSNGTIEDNKCLNNIKTGIYLQIDCSYNTIRNNYIYNSSNGIGIRIYESVHNYVMDNIITEGNPTHSWGIYIDHDSDFNTIINNTITTHTYGIDVRSSSHNNTIANNNIINAIKSSGISIQSDCNNNTVKMNNINGTSQGIILWGNANGSLVYGNILTNNSDGNGVDHGNYNRWDNGTLGNYWDDYGGSDLDDDGIGDTPYDILGSSNSKDFLPIWDDGLEPIYIDGEATGVGAHNWTWAENQPWCTGLGTFPSPYVIEGISRDGRGDGFCISIHNSDVYFEVRNCNLYNAGFTFPDSAIVLGNVGNGTIIGCDLTDTNFVGLLVGDSHNNTFIGNNASYTDLGFLLTHSDFNLLSGNTVNDCIENGINIDDNSDNNSIVENTMIGCTHYGISIFSDSNNNTVSGNTLIDNNVGISMLDHCDNNRVLKNELYDNNIGVSIPDFNSTNNVVYNNMFLLNTKNGEDDSFNVNYWNYGLIGNYWDDYGGVDANDDGIGDNAYVVSGLRGRLDNYPIWNDGDDIYPTIAINSPSGGSLYGTGAPTYSLNIFDLNLNQSWYTLNGTATRYFFTPTNGINVVPIDETGWDSFSDGSMLMTFYVNDSGENLASDSNTIIKDAINPTIALNSPLGGATFGSDAPEFNLTIYDLHLHEAWYTIGSSVTPYPFSPSNGINIVPIDESSWDALSEGSVTINFFVNDTVGNIQTIQVTITKDLPSSDPEPAIPFGNYYILFLGIGLVSILFVERKKRIK